MHFSSCARSHARIFSQSSSARSLKIFGWRSIFESWSAAVDVGVVGCRFRVEVGWVSIQKSDRSLRPNFTSCNRCF